MKDLDLDKLIASDLRGPIPEEDFSLLEQPMRIRSYSDIPDVLGLDIAPAEPLIDGMLYRRSTNLLAGADGVAKTYTIQRMALAVGAGTEFLGRPCRQTQTLYLDYEMPGFAVKDRLELLTGSCPDNPQPLTGVKFWGTWLQHQPPQIGSDLLLQICRETKPFLIIDPLRYSHDSDENDSGQMMLITRHVRSYAVAGATVLVVHHVAKSDGSTYRGSTALRGAFDCAWLQEQDEESGLLTLRCTKNRFGEKPTITIQPNFETGDFRLVDSPQWARRRDDIAKLYQIVAAEPGLSQNQIIAKAGLMKATAIRLLKEQVGRQWKTEPGPRNSTLYFPLVLENSEPLRTSGTGQGVVTGSVVLPLKGRTTQNQVTQTRATGSRQNGNRPDDDEREDLKF